MKIKLLNYAGVSHKVKIPDDTEFIVGQVISGDMVLEYPNLKSELIDIGDGLTVSKMIKK